EARGTYSIQWTSQLGVQQGRTWSCRRLLRPNFSERAYVQYRPFRCSIYGRQTFIWSEENVIAVRVPVQGGAEQGMLRIGICLLLQQSASQRSAFQNGLDELIGLEWFGDVLIHLCLHAFLAVADHCVGSQRDYGSPG